MGLSAAVAVAALATTYSAVSSNQQAQHAKGAAQAQDTALNAKVAEQTKADQNNQAQKAQTGSSTQQAALSALRASMASASTQGGTILTGPLGASPAPTSTKTLLGA